jgi:hypothetical protein
MGMIWISSAGSFPLIVDGELAKYAMLRELNAQTASNFADVEGFRHDALRLGKNILH